MIVFSMIYYIGNAVSTKIKSKLSVRQNAGMTRFLDAKFGFYLSLDIGNRIFGAVFLPSWEKFSSI